MLCYLETALINNSKRGASVTALGAVSTFYLERTNFSSLFGKDRLNIEFAKRKAVSAEKREQAGPAFSAAAPSTAIKEKNAATIQLINDAMKNNVLFMNLDTEHKSQIIAEMYRAEVKQGVSAIKQGDLGDNLYVVESGEFHVYVNGKQVGKKTLTIFIIFLYLILFSLLLIFFFFLVYCDVFFLYYSYSW